MKYRLLQDIKMPSYVAKAGTLFEEGGGTICPVAQDRDNYLSGIPVKDIVGSMSGSPLLKKSESRGGLKRESSTIQFHRTGTSFIG